MSKRRKEAIEKFMAKETRYQYVEMSGKSAILDGEFTVDELAEICDILNMEDEDDEE